MDWSAPSFGAHFKVQFHEELLKKWALPTLNEDQDPLGLRQEEVIGAGLRMGLKECQRASPQHALCRPCSFGVKAAAGRKHSRFLLEVVWT
eukprot:2022009-Amphidinium_carterae.1